MAKYRVTSLTVTPSKQQYAPGEEIVLNIKCTGERWAESILEYDDYYVSNYTLASSGAEIDTRSHLHIAGSIDKWNDSFSAKLSNPGPGSYEDAVVVKAWKRL